ncbi:alpha/beta fold hydrolase [Enterovibrio norvegicus]|uniref:alpha/beta fold hydrolase n=1 Tax=Enterovibrio norvegicus TaxID=188144 RepID=UPI000C826EA7|nr:alpha/beta hydrolase [Enterovibrio norvegicus]PMN68565.1 alpha/beta hydrolase [Enterovibrio norvegicus]
MFDGFTEEYVNTAHVRLFVRRGGLKSAPPLVLLHGYPQTSAMWHLVAPLLSDFYQVICPDLRGYGRSDKPETDDQHLTYSKRAMANDIVQLMAELGHDEFYVGAHDRGARVAHRLALDHPDKVRAMVLLDIAPTREMYAHADSQFAKAYWHWYFLTQSDPFPETLIGNDPETFWKLKCFNQAGGDNPFAPEALAEYLAAFNDPAAIHASCEDYRAGATIDIDHDNEDDGRKLSVPTEVLWAKHGVIERCFDAMDLWDKRASHISGRAVDATHYMAEEMPHEIADSFISFFNQFSNERKDIAQ